MTSAGLLRATEPSSVVILEQEGSQGHASREDFCSGTIMLRSLSLNLKLKHSFKSYTQIIYLWCIEGLFYDRKLLHQGVMSWRQQEASKKTSEF